MKHIALISAFALCACGGSNDAPDGEDPNDPGTPAEVQVDGNQYTLSVDGFTLTTTSSGGVINGQPSLVSKTQDGKQFNSGYLKTSSGYQAMFATTTDEAYAGQTGDLVAPTSAATGTYSGSYHIISGTGGFNLGGLDLAVDFNNKTVATSSGSLNITGTIQADGSVTGTATIGSTSDLVVNAGFYDGGELNGTVVKSADGRSGAFATTKQ